MIGALVTLYAAGANPVVVSRFPTTTYEGRGVGNVKVRWFVPVPE